MLLYVFLALFCCLFVADFIKYFVPLQQQQIKVTNMAKQKKKTKGSNTIQLRQRKLADGGFSLYLDCYHEGKRTYEYLGIKLKPGNDPMTKRQNNALLEHADAIRLRRELSIAEGKSGLKNKGKAKMLFYDVMNEVKASKSTARQQCYDSMWEHLKEYKGDMITIGIIDKAFVLGFIRFMAEADSRKGKQGGTLRKATAKVYYDAFAHIMKRAYELEYIDKNPCSLIGAGDLKCIKSDSEERGYLTMDEVRALMAVETRSRVKAVFMFSIFTGLRISDIRDLKWADIQENDMGVEIVKTMIKTKKIVKIPLLDEATKWMPERGDAMDDDYIFDVPASEACINKAVRNMAINAGITKPVSMHTARHTFATMAISSGIDLFATSKLLGHTDVKTTKVYADLIDKARYAAMGKISKAFNE